MLEQVARGLDGVPAFDFEEESYTYGDVVRAAQLRGEGQSPSAAARFSGPEPEPSSSAQTHAAGEIRARVVAFRRSHGLLSAQDYHAWLAERGLATTDVDAYARGQLPTTAEQLRAELILDGRLGEWAQELADIVAVAAATKPPAADLTGTHRLAAQIAAETEFRAQLLTSDAVARVVGSHRHDWQRIDWEELVLDSEGAAREAAMWVRIDGLALAEVAGLAHVESTAGSALHCELPPRVSPLLAAAPGELIGPLGADEDWRVATLRARRSVDPADPELRARAERELLERGRERYRSGRIRWHVEF